MTRFKSGFISSDRHDDTPPFPSFPTCSLPYLPPIYVCTLTTYLLFSISNSLPLKVNTLYLHAPSPTTPASETLSAVTSLHASGRIARFGLSNHSAAQVAEFLDAANRNGYIRPSVCQDNYNVVMRGLEERLLPTLRSEGISLFAYRYVPLEGIADVEGLFVGLLFLKLIGSGIDVVPRQEACSTHQNTQSDRTRGGTKMYVFIPIILLIFLIFHSSSPSAASYFQRSHQNLHSCHLTRHFLPPIQRSY